MFGNVQRKLRECQDKYDDLRSQPITEDSMVEEDMMLAELELLLEQEEILWKQRCKELWLINGDRNSRFFNRRATKRKKRNTVQGLFDENEVWVTEKEAMGEVANRYFTGLFASQVPGNFTQIIELVPSTISAAQNRALLAPLRKEEVDSAVKYMDLMKAPGPDGLSPKFFQAFWDVVGEDLFKAMESVFKNVELFPEVLNNTDIVLILKNSDPKRMPELRPISLCNVAYRIFSKIISNRLKNLMECVISPAQSAIIPGRLITDNLLLASEVMHYMKSHTAGRKGWMAAKIDMSKAFDRMEWSFLEAMMLKMGFHEHFVKLIMRCVSTVEYGIQLNGEEVSQVSPSRGLRQGDPLSPYLFIIGMEGLSALLRKAVSDGNMHGIKVCYHAPAISHLLFADDCFIFCEASPQEATFLMEVLHIFELFSGQKVNVEKSSVSFTRNMSQARRAEVVQVLGFKEVTDHGPYLGFPSCIDRNKNRCFAFVKDKVWKAISSWDIATLSKSG